MQKITMNWANTEHYEKAVLIAEANELDVKNPYDVQKVLDAQGFDVFMGDLKPWLKSYNSEIEIDLTLGAESNDEGAEDTEEETS